MMISYFLKIILWSIWHQLINVSIFCLANCYNSVENMKVVNQGRSRNLFCCPLDLPIVNVGALPIASAYQQHRSGIFQRFHFSGNFRLKERCLTIHSLHVNNC